LGPFGIVLNARWAISPYVMLDFIQPHGSRGRLGGLDGEGGLMKPMGGYADASTRVGS
jgi:hypothetical protein